MAEVVLPIAVIVALILVNAFFVAAEFAVAAAPRPRIAHLAESGSVAARHVLRVLSDPARINRYLSTAQIGITLASLGLGMYGEHAVADWLVRPLSSGGRLSEAAVHTISSIISVAFLTYLHVVLGEMVPKSLALQSAAAAAVQLSSWMALSERIFRPMTSVLNWLGNSLLALLGIPAANPEARLVSSDELAYIVEESSEGGLLDPTEQIFLENVIDFQQRTVGQVMTPRTRLSALAVDATRQEVLAHVCEERHSRYPIYEQDRDHIVGVLHIKDLARHLVEPAQTFDLRAILRPAMYVPEALPLDEMLARFRSGHRQVAVVLDEYGGTAGLVSLEDLAEEIIGEIQDEFDEEIAPFAALDERTLRVRGDLLLDELTQHFDLDFEAEEAETVGGLIMSILGRVPQPGESVIYRRVQVQVETVEGLAVGTALITLPAPPPGTDDAVPPPPEEG
jgi:CBS domain containing-hemolysin-like protein